MNNFAFDFWTTLCLFLCICVWLCIYVCNCVCVCICILLADHSPCYTHCNCAISALWWNWHSPRCRSQLWLLDINRISLYYRISLDIIELSDIIVQNIIMELALAQLSVSTVILWFYFILWERIFNIRYFEIIRWSDIGSGLLYAYGLPPSYGGNAGGGEQY